MENTINVPNGPLGSEELTLIRLLTSVEKLLYNTEYIQKALECAEDCDTLRLVVEAREQTNREALRILEKIVDRQLGLI